MVSYLIPFFGGILVFLFRKGKYERFHAIQSILVWVAVIVISIAIQIAGAVLGFIPVIGGIMGFFLGLISLLFGLGVLLLWLVLMWKAYTKERFDLPMVSQEARKISS